MNYQLRREKLQEALKSHQIDAFLVTQNVDIYYLTGTLQNGYLFVPAEGKPTFYVRKSVSRAIDESTCHTVALGSFRAFGDKLKSDYAKLFQIEPISIALEYDVTPVQIFHRLQNVLPNANWQDGTGLIRKLRMIKSDAEIKKIRRAAEVVDQALQEAVNKLYAGMTEVELMANIEYALRMRGHSGLMRMRAYNQEIITGMVGSGEAAAVPTYFDGPAGGLGVSTANPQSVSHKKIERNEPILLDLGCTIDGYVIDQTRTAVIGALPLKLEKAYAAAEHILWETERLLKPGVTCGEIYEQALKLAAAAGLQDHFMGYGGDQVKFLGHGIGLEVDEWPVITKGFPETLAPGMVIAIEPKFTFPGEGVVGTENTYLITEKSFEKLTVSKEGIWHLDSN